MSPGSSFVLQSENFTCSGATYAAVLASALQTRVLHGDETTAAPPTLWLCGNILPVTPQFKTWDGSRGGCTQRCCTQNLDLEGSSMAGLAPWQLCLPKENSIEQPVATPVTKACALEGAPPPPSDQKIRFSFAVERTQYCSVGTRNTRGGPVGNIITFIESCFE